MKFFTVLTLALASASAFELGSEEIYSRERLMPVAAHEGRIVGGQNADISKFGYQAGILSDKGGSQFWCGGSLIAPNWVLTAAHCTDDCDKVTVYLGSAKYQQGVAKEAIIIIQHPYYYDKPNDFYVINDIALIKIKPVELSENIWVVKLVPISYSFDRYNGKKAIASGWGKMSDNGAITTDLQQATMTVISNAQCRKTFGLTITSGSICVRTAYNTGRRSTCQGDSGGPLVIPKNDPKNNVQIGVASFVAAAGCESGNPAAFTFISPYRQWIENLTGV